MRLGLIVQARRRGGSSSVVVVAVAKEFCHCDSK
eukprot:CAMPEP_0196727286 /NCGR_PEP_ID=MMETSP1091-20130531/8307_1 /TAXON_ID=302021 /ORGANISM="Rhodomonas sp., Strain CCMP768" /LENGTH=33 /DNA_ID= /DNA_START= /DNA_END= /DNA_ORIENTATION=